MWCQSQIVLFKKWKFHTPCTGLPAGGKLRFGRSKNSEILQLTLQKTAIISTQLFLSSRALWAPISTSSGYIYNNRYKTCRWISNTFLTKGLKGQQNDEILIKIADGPDIESFPSERASGEPLEWGTLTTFGPPLLAITTHVGQYSCRFFRMPLSLKKVNMRQNFLGIVDDGAYGIGMAELTD